MKNAWKSHEKFMENVLEFMRKLFKIKSQEIHKKIVREWQEIQEKSGKNLLKIPERVNKN